jgi:hypothetical protein
MIAGLDARVHLFVRPEAIHRFIALFRDVFECEVRTVDTGMPHPIWLCVFGNGSSFSVEVSAAAPTDPIGDVSEANARHGAWIEFRTTNLNGVLARLDAAGVPSFTHPPSPHRYFSAPGGQVFRVVDIQYRGP